MRPLPAFAMARADAWPQMKAPVRFTAITVCHASRLNSRNDARLVTPALLT